MSKNNSRRSKSTLKYKGTQLNVYKFSDVWADDCCDALIGAMLVSFVEDYFRYLRAYNRHHREIDLIRLNSTLYQFEHCPWLVYVEGKTPRQLVEALVERGEALYGKKES